MSFRNRISTFYVKHLLLSFIYNQLLSSRNLSDMFSLGLGSWHSPDSRVRPTIIFLFETVKSREILFCVARGRGGVEEGGQLPGGRGLDGRPGQNARQQGGFLVSLDEQPRWHCKHLPRV